MLRRFALTAMVRHSPAVLTRSGGSFRSSFLSDGYGYGVDSRTKRSSYVQLRICEAIFQVQVSFCLSKLPICHSTRISLVAHLPFSTHSHDVFGMTSREVLEARWAISSNVGAGPYSTGAASLAAPTLHPPSKGTRKAIPNPLTYNASAPAIISINSVVIAAWRLRLYWMVSFWISSPALRVALSIAVIEAPCSEASRSSSAPNSWVRR